LKVGGITDLTPDSITPIFWYPYEKMYDEKEHSPYYCTNQIPSDGYFLADDKLDIEALHFKKKFEIFCVM
jgi:hypothetical protein